jgi:hypothetical protein
MAEASTTLASPQIGATLAPSFVIATAARRTAIKEVKRQMQKRGALRLALSRIARLPCKQRPTSQSIAKP